jgi:prevent-host-death family protein
VATWLATWPALCHAFSKMQSSRSMTVSDLKNKLLEVVRLVEKGEVIEITKDGEPVAVLSPHKAWSRPATGFARLVVQGSLELPDGKWTYDLPNLRPQRKRKP